MEENANVVVRLLIRRPECFGPALRGEGGNGLLAAMEEAIKISEDPARDGPTVKKDRRFMYVKAAGLTFKQRTNPWFCLMLSLLLAGLGVRSSRRRTVCIWEMPSCHSTLPSLTCWAAVPLRCMYVKLCCSLHSFPVKVCVCSQVSLGFMLISAADSSRQRGGSQNQGHP